MSTDSDRRRVQRVPTNNLVTYSAQRSDKLYRMLGTAVTLDLSDSGVRVRTVEPLPLAEELSFTLKLSDQTYNVRGRVVWGSEVDEDRQYEFGIKFKDLDFGLAKDLWKLHEQLLADTPAEPHPIGGMLNGEKVGSAVFQAIEPEGSKDADPELVLTIEAPRPAFREKLPTPKPRGMVGHFEGDQLVEFVQMLGMQAKTGVVEVATIRGDCFVALRDGLIIAARTSDGRKGEEAVYEIFSLEEGHFDFWPHALREVKAEHGLSVQSLLLEVMRRRDAPGAPA